jgi:hypothetical protein
MAKTSLACFLFGDASARAPCFFMVRRQARLPGWPVLGRKRTDSHFANYLERVTQLTGHVSIGGRPGAAGGVAMIDLVQGHDPFVAFVGAGASALAPSKLPTWTEFNNLLLECLCERLAEYSRNRQPTAEVLSVLRARRDGTRFFAPDFQAQLMEEEVGPDYFRVWQSLERPSWGHISTCNNLITCFSLFSNERSVFFQISRWQGLPPGIRLRQHDDQVREE